MFICKFKFPNPYPPGDSLAAFKWMSIESRTTHIFKSIIPMGILYISAIDSFTEIIDTTYINKFYRLDA